MIHLQIYLGSERSEQLGLLVIQLAELNPSLIRYFSHFSAQWSTSFTKWPLPRPPIAGLQDIRATLSIFIVVSRVSVTNLEQARGCFAPCMPTADYDDFIVLKKLTPMVPPYYFH